MVTFLMPTIRLEPSDSTIRSTRRKGYRCGNMLRMSWMFFTSWVLSIVPSETAARRKREGNSLCLRGLVVKAVPLPPRRREDAKDHEEFSVAEGSFQGVPKVSLGAGAPNPRPERQQDGPRYIPRYMPSRPTRRSPGADRPRRR